ncbi:Cloroperoxidase [Lentithecium fluviatile CBS 122367]|uniref:Cloroperoxidase n=1 Tax=Lentithecium fluviatile CBS 122367 TaxID=1168545 RepID=A0A6G1JPA4_9PLEO|nr:Cloroperoxidase [Lentithecium fluviatile CBS 122367]
MKLTTLLTAPLIAISFASAKSPQTYPISNPHAWMPAGPNDFRGPCPMMNTLANHAFLPHDGRNITKANAVAALGNGLGFDADLAELMWEQAVIANPEPNATFFTLDHLNRHNVLEHDASLSRTDAFFGNNHVFNMSIFRTSTYYWTTPILTGAQLANSKIARQLASKAFNPNYTFTANTENFSLGEVAAPFIVFGDMPTVTVNRTFVEFFFVNERLPEELGWKKKDSISLPQIIETSGAIGKAASLLTDGGSAAPHKLRRGDFHAGLAL